MIHLTEPSPSGFDEVYGSDTNVSQPTAEVTTENGSATVPAFYTVANQEEKFKRYTMKALSTNTMILRV